jgi:hypothetical protein
VLPAPAPGVGPDQGPDEQHGGPRRAGDARQARPGTQEQRVGARQAGERPFHPKAARHREEGEKQQDEGDVLEQQRVQEGLERDVEAGLDEKGERRERTPPGRDLAVVVVPELGRE